MLVFDKIYTRGSCFTHPTRVLSNQMNLAINITNFKVQMKNCFFLYHLFPLYQNASRKRNQINYDVVCTPVTVGLRRLRQEDGEFEVSMGYLVRTCLKKTRQNKKK
jgi:hypothetical protein